MNIYKLLVFLEKSLRFIFRKEEKVHAFKKFNLKRNKWENQPTSMLNIKKHQSELVRNNISLRVCVCVHVCRSLNKIVESALF